MKYVPLIAIAGLVTGCGSISSITDTTNLVDYSNHKSVKILEIPADLDQPNFDKTYVTDVSDKIAENQSVEVDSAVPLVDKSVGVVAPSASNIVKQGDQVVLSVSSSGNALWKESLVALKSMGMTVSSSDEAKGEVRMRDRSLVASSDNVIGNFLNRTIGKVNQGAGYRLVIKGSTVFFTDLDSRNLPEAEARSLLNRLQKALASS